MPRWAQPQEMAAVRDLWQARFGDSDAFADFFFRQRARAETTVVYEENGCISSALQIPPVRVRIRGHSVRGAMLCGVSTARQYEGRGHMGACLRFAMQALSDAECAIIVQKPVDFRIYERFSFVPVSDAKLFSLPAASGTLLSANPLVPIDARMLAQMCALYTRFCLPYSTCLVRDAQDFQVKMADYLCDGGEGWAIIEGDALAAYAFCETQDGLLHLRESAWQDTDAMERLFAALRSRAAENGLGFSGRIPADQVSSFAGRSLPFTAAAVGNTQALLREVFHDPDFCIGVTGSTVQQNDGIFDGNGCHVQRKPDFLCTSGQLVQLACGYRNLHMLAEEGLQIYSAAKAEEFDRRWLMQPCFTWDEY